MELIETEAQKYFREVVRGTNRAFYEKQHLEERDAAWALSTTRTS